MKAWCGGIYLLRGISVRQKEAGSPLPANRAGAQTSVIEITSAVVLLEVRELNINNMQEECS